MLAASASHTALATGRSSSAATAAHVMAMTITGSTFPWKPATSSPTGLTMKSASVHDGGPAGQRLDAEQGERGAHIGEDPGQAEPKGERAQV